MFCSNFELITVVCCALLTLVSFALTVSFAHHVGSCSCCKSNSTGTSQTVTASGIRVGSVTPSVQNNSTTFTFDNIPPNPAFTESATGVALTTNKATKTDIDHSHDRLRVPTSAQKSSSRSSPKPRPDPKATISPFFRISSLSTMCLFSISIGFATITWFINCAIGVDNIWHVVTAGMYTLCYAFGLVLIVLIFIKRLDITFRETTFAYRPFVFYILYSIVFVWVLASLFVSAAVGAQFLDQIGIFIMWGILSGSYALTEIVLSILFAGNLIRLSATIHERGSAKDANMVYVAIKYCLTVWTAVMSTLTVPLLVLLVGARPTLVSSIDMIINMCSLYLQFAFAKDKYDKIYRCCHRQLAERLLDVRQTSMHSKSQSSTLS